METLQADSYSSSQSDTTTHSPLKRFVSLADYWKKYYEYPDVVYEWNNGYLEEKPMSDMVTVSMYKWFFELLEHYLRTHLIGQSVLLEMGFSLTLSGKSEVRRPDLGVVLDSNPVPLLPNDKSYKGIYDLCVEAISDSSQEDVERDTVLKKRKYAEGGVKEYYILDGHDRYLEFYRLNAGGTYVPITPVKGNIIKSKVLPGFQFRIKDLFTKPSPE
jgi:hypothetical protein